MKIFPIHYSYLQIQNNTHLPATVSQNISDCITDRINYLPGYNNVYRDILTFKGSEKNFECLANRAEKHEIEAKFIQPLIRQNLHGSKKMPPIFMLAGVNDDELNLFKDYIVNRIADKNIRIIDLTDTGKEFFNKDVKRILQEAKVRYTQNKTKTIIYIQNAERFMGVNSSEAESTLDFYLTDAEKKLTEKNNYNQNIVNLIKGVTDYCSEEPAGIADKGNALTFLITSKNPHLINQDLLTRDGKLKYVYIDFPDKTNIASVLKSSATQDKAYLRKLKELPLKDVEDLDLPFDTWQNLYNLKRENKLYLLSIDDNIPFNLFSSFCVPDEVSGAFSTTCLQKSSRKALLRFIAEPQKSYSEHLADVLSQDGRDILPEVQSNNLRIKKLLNKEMTKTDSEMLREMFEVCNLPGAERQLLAKLLVEDNIKRITLQDKEARSGLNHNEKQELNRLREITINDSDIKKDLMPEMSEYIKSRTYKLSNGKYKFAYGNNKEDSVNLYLGNFGTNPKVLWIDSANPINIKVIEYLIDELKTQPQFNRVERLEFPQTAKESVRLTNAVKTNRLTMDYRQIYKIELENF